MSPPDDIPSDRAGGSTAQLKAPAPGPRGACSGPCQIGGLCGVLTDGIGRQNPVLVQMLGICSALAVTGFVATTLVMGAALLLVAGASSFLVSLMRDAIPHRVRLISQMLVVSVLVILVHLALQAYWFDMSKSLGPYVGLIITNCIILGRCEGYALSNPPLRSLLDGLGSGAGYALVLLAIALFREPLGNGTLLGHAVLPEALGPVRLIGSPAGAFLAMGILVWIVRSLWPTGRDERQPEAGR